MAASMHPIEFVGECLELLTELKADLLMLDCSEDAFEVDSLVRLRELCTYIKDGAHGNGLSALRDLAEATEGVLADLLAGRITFTPHLAELLAGSFSTIQNVLAEYPKWLERNLDFLLLPLGRQAPPERAACCGPEADEGTRRDEEREPEGRRAPDRDTISAQGQGIMMNNDDSTRFEQADGDREGGGSPERDSADTAPRDSSASSARETSIRVHVSLLDSLMTLAGELVLSRNQLLQTINANELKGVEAVGQRIDLITSELQEAIMLTRMQPIGNVFGKFPRVVRDLAAKLGKNVELGVHGKDVELDKTIIEAINDPLTHLVRNAIDHGIEPPDTRSARGKSETGAVQLRAYHEAGQVVIEIEDDGRGIDGDRLAGIAIAKGLITKEQAQGMSVKEKIGIIFLPGFSTAETVTDVSGRGVGMDVVKANLDKLGGQVDITSEPGAGTTISIKLPLTLAIIPCQIIVAEGERYAIPQVNLEELLRIPAHQIKHRIEVVGNAEVVRLRGRLLPLIRLADVLGIERTFVDPHDGTAKKDRRLAIADRRSLRSPAGGLEADSAAAPAAPEEKGRSGRDRRTSSESALNIVVVSSGAMSYGLIVDQLLDSEEIVIKPLGRHLQHCQGYAGATIMGDGRIALILDVSNLAQIAGLASVEGSGRAVEVARDAEESALHGEQHMVLIFRSSAEEQFGVRLDAVERIERITRRDIEYLGQKRTMKYRGGSLNLICIDDIAQVQPLAQRDDLLVFVFSSGPQPFGLLACGPIDTRQITSRIDTETLRQPGISGSSIIGEETTLLVDIEEIIELTQTC